MTAPRPRPAQGHRAPPAAASAAAPTPAPRCRGARHLPTHGTSTPQPDRAGQIAPGTRSSGRHRARLEVSRTPVRTALSAAAWDTSCSPGLSRHARCRSLTQGTLSRCSPSWPSSKLARGGRPRSRRRRAVAVAEFSRQRRVSAAATERVRTTPASSISTIRSTPLLDRGGARLARCTPRQAADRAVGAALRRCRDSSTSVTEHEVIIRALRAGDPDAAQQAVRTNWRNAAERLAAVIARAGERGVW